MPSLSVSDHASPTDAAYPDGVYRVVGTSDGAVTLLRLTDGDGRRIHTGELVTVDADATGAFERVDPPAATRSLGSRVASALEMGYWSLRAVGQQLRAHPRAAAAFGALALVGAVADAVLPRSIPDPVFVGLVFVGSLGLAYVGGGRL